MKNIWQDLPKPFFALAPMEAVTDVVFRHVVASAARPDIFFTEFVNASSYCSPKGIHSTFSRLQFTPDEQPIIAQIWGNKPDEFAMMCAGLKEQGYQAIDINMGCPDKSVVKNGCGSGLIRTPELAAEIIKSAKTCGLPISVKTRIGDRRVDEMHDWISHILRQDVVNLTVHLRTRKEMSNAEAHFELIPEILKLRDEIAPNTLITINGDIKNRAHGLEIYNNYKVDGFMIGRGIFQNPFAFASDETNHSNEDLLKLLNLQLDLHDKYSDTPEGRKFDPLKRFLKIYVRDFTGASELRDKLMHTKSTAEIRQIINNL